MNGKFVTLTYDDENIPIGSAPSLHKRDLQLFLKKLRKKNSSKLRFYAVGEYGSKTLRPHYHAVLFNVDPSLWDCLDDIWNFGLAHVGDITEASIHYVTKFHVNVDNSEVEGKEPEFVTMSRRPGIGNNYLKRVKSYHNKTKNNYVRNNGYKQRLPRYYRDKIFSESEKRAIRYMSEKEIDKVYEKEFERLKQLGIPDPDMYMERSQYYESLKVERKSKENDKL